jgi:hypothetical protein
MVSGRGSSLIVPTGFALPDKMGRRRARPLDNLGQGIEKLVI